MKPELEYELPCENTRVWTKQSRDIVNAKAILEDARYIIEATLHSEGKALTKIIHIVKLLVKYFIKTRHFSREMTRNLIIDVIFLIIDEDHGPLDHFDDIIKPIVESAVNEFFDEQGLCSTCKCTWRVFDLRTWCITKKY